MLYETQTQIGVFFLFILSGFLCGLIFDFQKIMKNKVKNKFFANFLLIFCVFLSSFIYFFINLIFNYGELRWFSLVTFLLSFSIEKIIAENIFALTKKICYNIKHGRGKKRKERRKEEN